MAVALKSSLEKLGYKVLIQIESEWYAKGSDKFGAVVVFRGLHSYKPKDHQVNILWNISHPDQVSPEEYAAYDHVFIASDFWAKTISQSVDQPVEAMLQCTEPARFHPPCESEVRKYRCELLFVGNSRGVFRKVLSDLLPTNYDLSIYGKGWGELVSGKYIKGNLIRNHKLYKYYGAAGALLNDHWDDMRIKGFISNRIFDALACGAVIISDDVLGLKEVFGNSVLVYSSKGELNECISFALEYPDEVRKSVQVGMNLVREQHTFDVRAQRFAEVITELHDRKGR